VACCCCCCVRTMYVIIEAWIYPVLFLHVTQNEFMISLVLTARGCVSAAASSWCCATRTSRRNRRSCCFFFFMLCLFSFLPEEGERGLDQGGRGGLSLSLSLSLSLCCTYIIIEVIQGWPPVQSMGQAFSFHSLLKKTTRDSRATSHGKHYYSVSRFMHSCATHMLCLSIHTSQK
jgi:hypothetical protein